MHYISNTEKKAETPGGGACDSRGSGRERCLYSSLPGNQGPPRDLPPYYDLGIHPRAPFPDLHQPATLVTLAPKQPTQEL